MISSLLVDRGERIEAAAGWFLPVLCVITIKLTIYMYTFDDAYVSHELIYRTDAMLLISSRYVATKLNIYFRFSYLFLFVKFNEELFTIFDFSLDQEKRL